MFIGLQYGLAICLVGFAALARLILNPVIGTELASFPPFFLACALAIRYTSTGPSLVAIVASCIAIDFFFLPPHDGFSAEPTHWLLLAVFALANIVVLSLAGSMRRQKQRAEAHHLQFRLLFEHSPDAVFLSVPDGVIKAANPAACAIFGLSEKEICARGRDGLADLSDPRNAAMAEERRLTGRVVNREATCIRGDGTKFPAEISSVILPGEPPQAFVILRDISKRKAAEDALHETQERFRMVAENARAVFGMVQGRKFVWANPYLSQISGYTPEEITSMDFLDLVHPDSRDTIADYARRRQLGEPAPDHYEFAMLTKAGETRWMDFSPARIEYNGQPAIIGTAYDITDRKRAEVRVRRFYESAMMGTIFWNTSGQITEANDKFLEMVGFTREDLKAGMVDWARMTPPEYRHLDERALSELRDTGVDTPYEKEFIRKDGTRIPIVVGAAMLDKFEGVAFVLDITTRRRAEEALRAREAELAEAQRIGHIGHWYWDPREPAPVVSEAGMRIFGLNPSVESWPAYAEQQGQLYPPEEWARLDAAVQRVLTTGRPYELDLRARHKKGHLFWVTSRGEAMRDSSGNIIGLRGTIQDITERKDFEQKLLAEKTFADGAINSMPGLFYLFDSSQHFVRWNKNFESVLGYSAADLPKLQVQDVIAPEDRQRVQSAIYKAMTEGEAEIELNLLTKDGRPLPYFCSGRRFDHEGQTRLIGVAIDISERKRFEDALRQSEHRFRIMGETIDYGVWMCNKEGGAEYASQSFLDLLNMSMDEMKQFGWTTRLVSEDVPLMMDKWLECVRTGKVWDSEYRIIDRHGHVRTILTRGKPVRDSQGRITSWVGINLDITERKKTEHALAAAKEKLGEYSESLEKLVQERTQKLNETVHELEQFSYAITHDMRAPLRAMHGFSRMLLHECTECMHGDRRETLRRIADAATRMDSLITDSLNYSKIVSQRFELEPVDVHALLKGILETYPEFHPHKADIKIEGVLPTVCGNNAGLTQCCSNLLSNAVKFAEPDKVPEVRIWAETRGEFTRLNFKDNGIGIPRQYQDKIWDMFEVLSKKYEGTGIGLAVVKKVVQRMGGTAGVVSEPGKGSCFWLELRRHIP